MRALRSSLGLLGTLALASLPAPAIAQKVGSEFQINTYTTGHQGMYLWGDDRAVAADGSGNFVVVWSSADQDGSGWGVFGQRYDSGGVPQGTEFRVNAYTPSSQWDATVAAAPDGNFLVVWESRGQDGNSWGIFGQRYDNAGAAQGDEFRVNFYTTQAQSAPSVAFDASGNFVVVWQSAFQDGDLNGIFGQRYDSAGAARGNEFRVNSYTTNYQTWSSVASDTSGNFVVVWESHGQDRSGIGIFGQRYDSAGVAQGAEFRVNSYTTDNQRYPSVASDAGGNFVVVWTSYAPSPHWGIFGQRYDNAGVPQGDEFRVSLTTPSCQYLPCKGRAPVASDASGNFLVVWGSLDEDVFGQRYDSAGAAQGQEFRINSFTIGTQQRPSVQAVDTDAFVVVWESDGQDGSGLGVFGQRFKFGPDTTPPTVSVSAPNGGEKLFTGSSYQIRWTASDDTALSSFDASASVDGGDSFTPIAECQRLPGSARRCVWIAPGPPSVNALVRVAAEDTSGNSATDDSNGIFRIVSGAGSVMVVSPNTNVKWRIGSHQTIKWTHNLGLNSTFRIELDRYNDGAYEELIAAGAPATTATRGSFAWTVSGPTSATARVRVSWSGNLAISDSSDLPFQIRPAPLD